MKSKASSLPPNIHRDSLHRHLQAYALTASAAGVSLLALAAPAEAEIIYTPANVTIGLNQSYDLDLNNDGITDFTIAIQSAGTGFSWNMFLQSPGGGNAVAGHMVASGGLQWPYAFYSGFLVATPRRHFISSSRALMASSHNSYRQGGSWAGFGSFGVFNRYLGLKFTIHGKTHYGWAQLSTYTLLTSQATLTGYAYETVPNKPITTGKTQGNDDIAELSDTPALSQPTLGHLANGARAISVWRQNQRRQIQQRLNEKRLEQQQGQQEAATSTGK